MSGGEEAGPPDPAKSAENAPVGLLFVHGIGEQKRFEHLTSSVVELTETMRRADGEASISVEDRTPNWDLPPGVPHPEGLAPISFSLATSTGTKKFDCYEVWWADLGGRSGLLDQITFWLWGLGQWNAPIYQELDGSRLNKGSSRGSKPASDLTAMPSSVAGLPHQEALARFRLLLAAIAAIFVALTWTLAKRVLASLLGSAPSPTLVVSYVGDVRTYEERAAPGDSAVSDPGHPRRVGIRRRMVQEMVFVGSRHEKWWVLAHSLGTVVAYNGLTEIGHTLPNYLTREQWARLDSKFKTDGNCKKRTNFRAMMPARPEWLGPDDVVNRDLLLGRLQGFLTYGSPLDKFAGLWPRIVATATDREDGASPFRCPWVNLAAPQDPVAGMLCRYPPAELGDQIPDVKNVAMPFRFDWGLAHIRYFAGAERDNKSTLETKRREVAQWVAGLGSPPAPRRGQPFFVQIFTVHSVYLAIIAAAWLTTSALAAAFFGLAKRVTGVQTQTGSGAGWWNALKGFWSATWSISGLVLGVSLCVIALFGLWRWARENALNLKLARFDGYQEVKKLEEAGDPEGKLPDRKRYWRRVKVMLAGQSSAGTIAFIVGAALMALSLISDFLSYWHGNCALLDWACRPEFKGLGAFAAAIVMVVIAILVQSVINVGDRLLQVLGAAERDAPTSP